MERRRHVAFKDNLQEQRVFVDKIAFLSGLSNQNEKNTVYL